MKRAALFLMGTAALFLSLDVIAGVYYWNQGGVSPRFETDQLACEWVAGNYNYTLTGVESNSSTMSTCVSAEAGGWALVYRGTCASGTEFNAETAQCEVPPSCPEPGTQIRAMATWQEYQNSTFPASISYEGCEYTAQYDYGAGWTEDELQTHCYVALNGETFCQIPYGASGNQAGPTAPDGTPLDTPVEDQTEWEEKPVQTWAEEAPYTQQDNPLPGDSTTTTQKTETTDYGDSIKVDNQTREYIEIDGNTYTKTTTTTTTTKSDGTEIVETTVEYSNSGTTTTTYDLDNPSQSNTHTAGGGTGSATTTTTTNTDGSSSSTTTQAGDPEGAEEEGEQEQEKFADQPSQEGMLDSIDSFIEGVGQGELGDKPEYDWSMAAGIGCQPIPWAFGGKNGNWDGYCPFWENTIRPALAWMVYILTVIALIGIWRDTTKRS